MAGSLVCCCLLMVMACGLAFVLAIETTAIPPFIPDDDNSTTSSTERITTTTPKTTTTTTTTMAPNTTTSTTTPEPETTTPTTTTTTEKTTTTTLAPVPPTPVPAPTANHWAIKDKDTNKFCLMVDMAVQVNLTYKTKENLMAYTLYDIPVNNTMKGSCGKNLSSIYVSFENETGLLALVFNLNETKYQLDVAFNLQIVEDQFPGAAKQSILIEMQNVGPIVPQGMSYHCNRQQSFNATEATDTNKLPATIALSKVQWQAFHDRDSDGYDLAKDCDANDTPDIVPIAVGCALAGLVVVVLLGYLVGRRRSQNRGGYLSM